MEAVESPSGNKDFSIEQTTAAAEVVELSLSSASLNYCCLKSIPVFYYLYSMMVRLIVFAFEFTAMGSHYPAVDRVSFRCVCLSRSNAMHVTQM